MSDVRNLLQRAIDLIDAENPPEKAGKTRVVSCSCGKDVCHGELHVIPIKVGGSKRVDLRTISMGGVVLSPEDRSMLIGLLSNREWFGD